MKIQDIFEKDIFRAINGVVKAEQQDNASILQELDEFVITKELIRYIDTFFSIYSDSLETTKDSSGDIGVWVSGFFGSGKSHFIKALSYLFKNITVDIAGKTKHAYDFFESRIDDALLVGSIKKAISKNTDVILFNIDSKADQTKGRDAILSVFLKVFNELQGYSPDHPHIAHMERYLQNKGKYELFKENYNKLVGDTWLDQRDSYMFNQDEVVKTLSQTLGQSEESCHRWIDHSESDFSLTVENFAKWVKEYLDSKGKEHRIFFFVDEIGQFIGQDGHLMLNLQTIVENLGVSCEGRAWIMVTSQEDIDKVLGSLNNTRTNDFSKIQGRFKTRLSLSSANTDEVIQKRLLEKNEPAKIELEKIFKKHEDILKNQLTFSGIGMTLSAFTNTDDFIKNFPFIPYQFKLLQKVFETIRRAGATGLHLSRGERSMLDAFQHAVKIASSKDLDVLVPLYWFYPSIESFLDTAVKRTIDQAGENPVLNEFDVLILQTLFLIRYIDEIKGSVDNIVTLCIDSLDADRLELKKNIEDSLHKLEKETLISRSGDNFFFLTNEEQDVSREIKNVELDYGGEGRLLGSIIYDDIYKDTRKHRYQKTNKDFNITRLCDKHALGSRIEGGLLVSIISPFYDDHDMYDQMRCMGESLDENGCVLIKMPDHKQLAEEIRIYLKTERYIDRKNDTNPEVARILRDRKDENKSRKKRITDIAKEMIIDADYYVSGKKYEIGTSDPITALVKVCDYLIDNTFNKMSYIEHPAQNAQMEIQSLLRSYEIGQMDLDMTVDENNPKAITEIRDYIDLCNRTSKQIILNELVDIRFSNRPYGWPEWGTVHIVVKMLLTGEINFIYNSNLLEHNRVYEIISKTSNWKKIVIQQRRKTDTQLLEGIRKLGQELFSEMGPDGEDNLYKFLKEKFLNWETKLREYKVLAETGKYVGLQEITKGLNIIAQITSTADSYVLMKRISEIKDDLIGFSEDYHDIDNFYKTQRLVWDQLQEKYRKYELNRFELEKNEDAQRALLRMDEILKAPAPYKIISEISSLIEIVNKINNQVIEQHRNTTSEKAAAFIEELVNEANKIKSEQSFIDSLCKPINDLKEAAMTQESVAHLKQIDDRMRVEFDRQIQVLAEKEAEINKGKENKPVLKKVKEINIESIVTKPYLESEADVNVFIEKLKKEMDEAIKNGDRIRVV